MSDLNQCNFIGRLGSNPEMRTTQTGDAMATFSIAVSEKYNDRNGNRTEKTEWVNIQAFGKLAEIMGQYLSKGSQVFISGKLQSRKYMGQDGVERIAVSILAKDMQMLGSKKDSGQSQWQGQNTAPQGQWQAQGGYNQPQGQWQQPPNTTYNRNPPGQNTAPQTGQQYQTINGHPTTTPVGQQPPSKMANDDIPF